MSSVKLFCQVRRSRLSSSAASSYRWSTTWWYSAVPEGSRSVTAARVALSSGTATLLLAVPVTYPSSVVGLFHAGLVRFPPLPLRVVLRDARNHLAAPRPAFRLVLTQDRLVLEGDVAAALVAPRGQADVRPGVGVVLLDQARGARLLHGVAQQLLLGRLGGA